MEKESKRERETAGNYILLGIPFPPYSFSLEMDMDIVVLVVMQYNQTQHLLLTFPSVPCGNVVV